MKDKAGLPVRIMTPISSDKAKEYVKNYLEKREQGICNKCDTISVWFSIGDLLNLVAQAGMEGALLSGVRIYFGAHKPEGNNTLVLVPTQKKGNVHEDILTEIIHPVNPISILVVNEGQQCPPTEGLTNECDGLVLLDEMISEMEKKGQAIGNLFRKQC